jgi:hypothetical protein
MFKPLPDDRLPKDKRGNVIGIGDILIARRDDGETLRYRVLAVDHLQGSGSVKLECLVLVEQGFKIRWESIYNLWQGYEVESEIAE